MPGSSGGSFYLKRGVKKETMEWSWCHLDLHMENFDDNIILSSLDAKLHKTSCGFHLNGSVHSYQREKDNILK